MRSCVAVVVFASWLLCGSLASAQAVSDVDQERANTLVTEGNGLVTSSPPAALEKYQAAIQIWDNPVFHYRLAVTLMQLGRDDEARAELATSLRAGAAPFDPADYQQAVVYQKMLDDKLHGNDEVRYERRFSTWIPWTVLGVSGVGIVAGIALDLVAASDMNEYDQRVESACAVNGCNFDNPQTPQEQQLVDELNAQRDRAQFRDKLATFTLVGSAAMLVTGIVLVVLNQPRAVRVDAHASAGGATASLGWDF